MKKEKTIIFCAHWDEVKYLILKIKKNSKEYELKGENEIEIDNHIYMFISIMSTYIDGLTFNDFLLSPLLLKKGSQKQIDLAMKLGMSGTAPYR